MATLAAGHALPRKRCALQYRVRLHRVCRAKQRGLLCVLAGIAWANAAAASLPPPCRPEGAPGSTRWPCKFTHRFHFALGYERASRTSIGAPLWRASYDLGWRGWSLGAGLALDLSTTASDDQARGEHLGFVGVAVRRYFPLGDFELWAGAELSLLRFEKGIQGDAEAILYAGTSSAAELGLELGAGSRFRPFVSLRADLPWFTTQGEALSSGAAFGAETRIERWQRWTPLVGIWAGLSWRE